MSPKVLIQVQSRTPGLHTCSHFFLITTQSRRNCHSLAKEPEAQRGLVPDLGEASCGTMRTWSSCPQGWALHPQEGARNQDDLHPPSGLPGHHLSVSLWAPFQTPSRRPLGELSQHCRIFRPASPPPPKSLPFLSFFNVHKTKEISTRRKTQAVFVP